MPPVKFGLPAVDQKTYDDYVDDSFEKQTGADLESLAQVSQQRAKVDEEALAAFDEQADADIASIAGVRQAEEEAFLGRMDADIASIKLPSNNAQSQPGSPPEMRAPAASNGRQISDQGADPLDRAFGDLGPQAVANMKAIMQKESGGRPDAVKNDEIEDSRGRLQINARAHPELAAKYDLLDPEQNAMAAREVWNKQGYKAWHTASKQLGLLDGASATGNQPRIPPVAGAPDRGGGPAVLDTRVEAVSQFAAGLPDEEAWAACGPVAALAFAQANGRNPTLKEAMALAKEVGWTAAGGMNGVQREKALLDKWGVANRLETAPDFGAIAQDAENGNPVIVSTPKHYYYVNGYDKATGRLHVGKTGESRKGGGSWMSAQQIAELDGGINGALFVDNPNTPTPSVAAGGPAPVGEPAAPSTYDDTWNDQPEAPAPPAVGGSYDTPQAKVRGILNQLGDAILGLVGQGGQAAENLGQAAGNAVSQIPGGTFDPLDPVNKGVLPLPLPSGREAVDWARSSGRQMVEQFGRENEAIGKVFQPGATDADWRTANEAGLNAAMTLGPESLRRAGTAAAGAAARRMFHGTGSAFEKPDPAFFNPQDLYGPGHYVTSDPRVAGGYAQTKAPGADALDTLDSQIRRWREISDDPRELQRLGVERGGALEEVARLEATRPDVLAGMPPAGPNIRPTDIPPDLNLLRTTEKVDPSTVELTRDALRRLDERVGTDGVPPGQTHLGAFEGVWRGTTKTGDGLYNALESALGHDKALVNTFLRGVGYDGIAHPGGNRMPIVDENGRDIKHDAMVIFEGALPKVRNALTGAPGGQIDARYAIDAGAAAAGGTAGYLTAEEDATIGQRIARTALGAAGGLGASRIGQAALSPEAMAGTARLGIAGPQQTTQLALPLSVPGGPPRSTVYDKVSVVRMAGMLSGTGTQLLNAASNSFVGGSTLAFKLGQVALDASASKLTGKERERYLAEFGPQLRGYGAGAWAGIKQVPGILTTGASPDALEKMDARRFNSGNKVVDAVAEMPLRILSASDAIFRGASFGGHAGALAVRQAIKEGLDGAARAKRADDILANLTEHPNLLDEANRLAARDVLQEARGATQALSKMRREGGVTGKALDVFLPFSTSPYNAAAQGAGMTPAGYLAAIKAARDGNTGEAVDRAVRATAGTLGLVTGLHMAANGYLTGAYPEDADDRSTLPEGWKPYAVRIPKDDGAIYVPLQMLGNLAVPLGLAAIYAEAQAKGASDADANKTLLRALKGVGGYVLDTSAMQGLTAIGELARSPERQFERFTESLTASYVPYSALGRQVSQAFGVAQRDPEGALEAFVAAIPGLSSNVREKITPLGSPRRQEPTGPMALVTGSRIGVEQDEPTLRVLRDARVSIPPPPKEVKNIRLTEAEGRMFQEIAGRRLRELIEPLEGDPEYLGLSPVGREKRLNYLRDKARQRATNEVIESIEADEISRRKQKARDARDARQPLLSLREGNR